MRRAIGQTSGQRGRKFARGRRDSKPSVGLVLKRSSTRGYTAGHPTDIKRLATSSSPRGERVQQVQRRCPWARAMIASPYIRQLRYGLPLCCIHGQSRGKDGLICTTADWRGQICDGFRQPHIRPAQRPHEGASELLAYDLAFRVIGGLMIAPCGTRPSST
jgi:hypothetical protein